MIRNYFKLVIRGFIKNRFYTGLNIVGLAIGFASALIISIYVYHEFTYDRFHKDYQKVYRLSDKQFALTSIPHLNFLKDNIPGIDHTTVLLPANEATIEINNKKIKVNSCYFVAEDFFKVFPYPVKHGATKDLIKSNGSVVLTNTYATKLFGNSNVVGETIRLHNEFDDEPKDLVITAILEDIPANSHLQFELLASFPPSFMANYSSDPSHTVFHGYLRLAETVNQEHLIDRANLAFAQQMLDNGHFSAIASPKDLLDHDKYNAPVLMNVADIHLHSNLEFEISPPAYSGYLIILLVVASFILILATVNYANLAMVLAIKRAKEIGIRKVLGSQKQILLSQFILEAVFLNLMALFCSFAIVEGAIGLTNQFSNLTLNFSLFTYPQFIVLAICVAILTGIAAGLYPGWQLSSYKPGEVLKGGSHVAFPGKRFRQSLFVLQFTLAMVLGIFGWFVHKQINYGLNKDLGFDHKGVININNANDQLGASSKIFCQDLMGLAEIESASLSFASLSALNGTYIRKYKDDSPNAFFKMHYKFIDDHYLKTLGFNLLSGRNFDTAKPSDTASVIINQQMANRLAIDQPFDQYIEWGQPARIYEVIGIIEDFHHKSLQHVITPAAFFYNGGDWGSIISVKLTDNQPHTIDKIQQSWKKFTDFPMIYLSMERQINRLYQAENQLSSIISIFTFLAIIVTSLGIIGLSGFLAQMKTKEIGIRKVLGATIQHILILLSSKFSMLVFLALIIASPTAFWLTTTWLENFSYQINLSVWPFFLVGMLCFLLTVLATSFHFIKAAMANPIIALNVE